VHLTFGAKPTTKMAPITAKAEPENINTKYVADSTIGKKDSFTI